MNIYNLKVYVIRLLDDLTDNTHPSDTNPSLWRWLYRLQINNKTRTTVIPKRIGETWARLTYSLQSTNMVCNESNTRCTYDIGNLDPHTRLKFNSI